jgi:hypothetical protein
LTDSTVNRVRFITEMILQLDVQTGLKSVRRLLGPGQLDHAEFCVCGGGNPTDPSTVGDH